MLGIVLALLAAFVYALSTVIVRRWLDESNFVSVTLVITVVGNVVLWPLALLFADLGTVSLEGVLLFFISGILDPGIVTLLYFRGMEIVGVSVNSSIFTTSPMYSSIFAVFLLSEALTLGNWIGIICIVVGVVCVERILSKPKTGPERITKKGLVFPLLAALTLAFSSILRKHALNIYHEPLLGVATGLSSSLLLYFLLLISSHNTRGSMFSGKDFRLFWKAGVCLSLGHILFFYALVHGSVSVVAPLSHTEPLFILFFAYLYLKEFEHISFNLILSTLLIVTGAMLISS